MPTYLYQPRRDPEYHTIVADSYELDTKQGEGVIVSFMSPTSSMAIRSSRRHSA
jgi:hypothetical protein